jgi:protein-tyrosine phosphatase
MARDLAFVPLERMPQIAGLAVPSDAYWILRGPGPLLGMARPTSATPWKALQQLGVRRVVCLTDDVPAYDPSPLAFACAVKLQDLDGGIAPIDAAREEAGIERAVSSVLEALRRGEGVVVHCAGGTGRTGTVIGATLCALGIPAFDVIAHLQAVNKLRGRSWPESPWQEDLLRRLQI